MCEMNQKILILKNLERKRSFYILFLANQHHCLELPRKWKMENFHVFGKNYWQKGAQNQFFHTFNQKSGHHWVINVYSSFMYQPVSSELKPKFEKCL
jgi:hypothetical protein